MKQEDYVSFEVAKMLKKKGYKEPCNAVYTNVAIVKFDNGCVKQDWNHPPMLEKENIYTSAPSLAQAAKWLREDKSIDVLPYLIDNEYVKKYHCSIYRYGDLKHIDFSVISFDTYEQALNEGIKEALKMI